MNHNAAKPFGSGNALMRYMIIFLTIFSVTHAFSQEFQNAEARAAKAEFDRGVKDLEREHDERRAKLVATYVDRLKKARAASLASDQLDEAQLILETEKELSTAKRSGSRVAALIASSINDRPPSLAVLLADGRIFTVAGAEGTWKADKGNLLLNFPNPRAPGGAYTSRLQPDSQRRLFTGPDNNGSRISYSVLYGAL